MLATRGFRLHRCAVFGDEYLHLQTPTSASLPGEKKTTCFAADWLLREVRVCVDISYKKLYYGPSCANGSWHNEPTEE